MSVLLDLVKNEIPAKPLFTLPFLVGLLIFVLMTIALGEISARIINHHPLTIADVQLSTWIHDRGSPFLTRAMLIATYLGATMTVTCISIVFGLYLLWLRRLCWLAALVLSVPGGALLNRLLKFAFQRPRPHFDDPILRLTSYSFPSGHTMIATVLYGVLAAYLVSHAESTGKRLLVILSAIILIALVGFSRIYLGAHYLTDVLGALAEGLAWLSLCLTAVYSVCRKRNLKV